MLPMDENFEEYVINGFGAIGESDEINVVVREAAMHPKVPFEYYAVFDARPIYNNVRVLGGDGVRVNELKSAAK